MITITKADLLWIIKLLEIIEYFRDEFPEEFTNDEDEAIKVVAQLLRSKYEDSNI